MADLALEARCFISQTSSSGPPKNSMNIFWQEQCSVNSAYFPNEHELYTTVLIQK